MQRMASPVTLIPGAMAAMQALSKAAQANSDVPITTHHLIDLRVSQINGCAFCVEMHAGELRGAGVSDTKIDTVAAWRDAPYFTPAERAALALAEAVTRLSDRPDAVPDALWDEVTAQYDDAAVASLLLSIAKINVWNRLNVPIRQPAGAWAAAAVPEKEVVAAR